MSSDHSPREFTQSFFEIRNRICFELRGPDALRYLNGQVSIDVSRLKPAEARPACLLTAKGKLCAPLFIWRSGDSFLIEAPAELAESLQARLERYIIADDVELLPAEIPSTLYHILPCAPSPTLASQPAKEGGTGVPPVIDTNARNLPNPHPTNPPPVNEVNQVKEVPLTIPRLNLLGCDTTEKPTRLPELSANEIELLRILNGVPLWGRELSEDTLPQEARLEDRSVDFDKGCYVGQETVSRLKSVGRVNKRLHGFLGTFDATAAAPVFLRAPGNPATTAGQLTSWAPYFDVAQTAALGYLNRQFENLPRLEVADETGRTLGEVERREFPIQ